VVAAHVRGLATSFSSTSSRRALDRLDACTERRAFADGVARVLVRMHRWCGITRQVMVAGLLLCSVAQLEVPDVTLIDGIYTMPANNRSESE
jgi:hypothetical protein